MLNLIDQVKPDDLNELREHAARALKTQGLPKGRKEPFKYIPLSKLYGFDSVLSRGQISASDSAEEIVILPLRDALKSYGPMLKKQFATNETDPFALLARSLVSDGLFIYVPPNQNVAHPICLKDELQKIGDDFQVSSTAVHIVIGRASSAKIIVDADTHLNEYCRLSHISVAIEDGASLKMLHNRKGSEDAWEFESVRAYLKKDSSFESFHITEGGKSVRSDLQAVLQGENSSATFKGLADLQGVRQAHQYVMVEHQAPNTHSEQLFKTVLNDQAQSSFEGKIYVHSVAQQTRAYQLNNHLLLGDKAVANSKPNLEIFADDVKASHGSTMGQLNADEMFYLQSRGIGQELAKKMLKSGFCAEILGEVNDVFDRNL